MNTIHIPRRGYLLIAPRLTSDDIPRRGFLTIAPYLATDKDAPKGHNLNNTVQAAGAVRCLYDETECVPKGRDIKNIFLSIAPCLATGDIPRRGFLSIAPYLTADKDAPKGHDLNNTVQAFFVQCRDRREQHCKNAQCGARHNPSPSVPKGRDPKENVLETLNLY